MFLLDAVSDGDVPVSSHFHKTAKAVQHPNNKTDVGNNRFGTKMHTGSLLGEKKKVFNWITNTGYRIFRWQDPLVSKLGLRYLDLFLSSVSDFLHDFGQVSLRFRVVFAMLLKHFLIPQCGDVTCIVLDHRK